MKKLILAVSGVFLALSSYASIQYNYGTISAANSDFGNSKYTAFADRGGKFGLQNTLYFNSGAYLYLSFSKGTPEFGAYYLNEDRSGKADDIRIAATGDGNYTAVDASGKAIQFQEGDSIGFWVKDENGNIVYNTPGINGQHTYNGTTVADRNNYMQAFGNYGQSVNSPNGNYTLEDMIDAAQSVMNVQVGSTAPAPSGQPLPGVLAALFIGGGTCAGLRFRRK